ncbi:MAG: hypothetical protein EXX96DRAFT_580680 [Benjaminiella poitrasii]|nr:MAG: hypothetical protein EXX96DRAFT_580611 [Benjaminiella poitrasii]KAI9474127.1 MAG: hypothetical protein EXX96DRAFT_580680 [Benjaminiella poitrasii]
MNFTYIAIYLIISFSICYNNKQCKLVLLLLFFCLKLDKILFSVPLGKHFFVYLIAKYLSAIYCKFTCIFAKDITMVICAFILVYSVPFIYICTCM